MDAERCEMNDFGLLGLEQRADQPVRVEQRPELLRLSHGDDAGLEVDHRGQRVVVDGDGSHGYGRALGARSHCRPCDNGDPSCEVPVGPEDLPDSSSRVPKDGTKLGGKRPMRFRPLAVVASIFALLISATAVSADHFQRWIRRNARGRVVLDYCCGDGARAITAAKAGASLSIGLDISRTSVENATRDAAAAGVADNTYFVQADAENTRLPDESVDVVIASGVLHHLDLSFVFPELRRILTPGGRVFAFEALDYRSHLRVGFRQLAQFSHVARHRAGKEVELLEGQLLDVLDDARALREHAEDPIVR